MPEIQHQSQKSRIAIIGAGVAGITCAHILQRSHQVTLFEKADRIGGHTNTVTAKDQNGLNHQVDTGFIVFNDLNYPNFTKLLASLNVSSRNSDMSFSMYNTNENFYYAGTNLNGLFSQRSNIISPRFWKMIRDFFRFNKFARNTLKNFEYLQNMTLGDFLKAHNFESNFINNYIASIGSAVWSTPIDEMLDFPAQTFIQFFENHHLLQSTDRLTWKTVVGGSKSYVTAFEKQFSGTLRINSDIRTVRRSDMGVEIQHKDGHEEKFDAVVFAVHADQVLSLLETPTADEVKLFSPWKYQKNRTQLHTNTSLMPPSRNAYASWNYYGSADHNRNLRFIVSYYMNQLQGLETKTDFFVTLNGESLIQDKNILYDTVYEHPTYTFSSLDTQKKISSLNGQNKTYYAGSYLGYGFHEDAVKSACAVAEHFGLTI